MMSNRVPSIPDDLSQLAILLDVDGTLLDFAPTPREVFVSHALRETLGRLWERTGGAVAFVSGRPVNELDLIFSPLQLPAIGGHGAELRTIPGAAPESPRLPPLDPSVKRKFAAIAEAGPGIILEDKGYSLALHYRLAPEKERMVREAAARICAELKAFPIELLPGKLVVEIKQTGFTKATAVRELMTYAAVRRPAPVFHRRRRDRSRRVRDHARFRRNRHFGGPQRPRRRILLRAADRCSPLARADLPHGRARGLMIDHGLDLAVIGNGRTAALVDPTARLVWWCYPRFDRDPIFCRLLSGDEEKGFSDVVLDDMADFQSEYLRNTAVVSTVLTDRQGGAVRITDFAPRYRQFGRVFRPPQLIRMIEPVAGLPRITIRFRPTHDYGHPFAQHSVGSNHIRYVHEGTVIRLTTDAPLSYIESEAPFVLTRPLHLVFGVDEQFQDDLETTCREFCDRTIDYWMDWSRGLSISYDWQDEIIRAAITLKLSNFEETGGIIAAHTTSIPEAPGSGRTWDYRYCWLRDAYFVVKALNRIGATQTMEDFISFTLSIASNPNEIDAPGLQRRPHRADGRNDRARAQGLSRRRAGAHRQCGGRAGAERYLWQRHSRRHADVLRPAAAAARRRRPVSAAGIARRQGGRTRFGGRQRDLGISRAPAHPHPFDRDVLGRLSPARRHRHRGSVCRTGRRIGTPLPNPCTRRCCRVRGTRNGKPSPPPSARTISTPASCCCPISA